MLLIRSLTYFLFLAISVLVYTLLLLIVGLFTDFKGRSIIASSWGKANLLMLKHICGLNYRIEGQENITDNNCVVMCKHQSAWETIALRAVLPVEQTWVLKKELMLIPFFGWGLRMVYPIAIDRRSGRVAAKQIIEQGTTYLNAGRWVIIFPEGTRVAPGERKKYGIGGGLLAEKSGYPVLPISHNAGALWRRRSFIKYPGTITLRIGRQFSTKGLTAAQITRQTEDWIESNIPSLTN